MLVGQIVAEVSGKSYMEYARENILIPLGMKTTDFTYSSQAMIEKAAAGAFSPDEVAVSYTHLTLPTTPYV